MHTYYNGKSGHKTAQPYISGVHSGRLMETLASGSACGYRQGVSGTKTVRASSGPVWTAAALAAITVLFKIK